MAFLTWSAVVLVLLAPAPVTAQPAADSSLPESATAAAPPAQAEPAGWRFSWDEHPSLIFGKDTRIDFRLRLQTRFQNSEAETGDDGDVTLARRRVGVHGTIKNLVDFQVERDFREDDPWRDVFVNYRQYSSAEVQAGKFKLPFSLEENTSSANLDFITRSMAATELSPGRDNGAMVHGRLRKRTLRYEVGWFAHDGTHARTQDPEQVFGGSTLAARLSAQPFRQRHKHLRDFQVGVALTESSVAEGYPGLHGHTVLDASFFPSNLWVKGQRHRTGLELRWRPGPASIKAEYMRVSTERNGQSVEDTDLSPLVARGWYISGTYALTGEKKADDLTVPRRPVTSGGPGAIEVAARVEGLSFGEVDGGPDASTSPRAEVILGNADHATTFGVNWYPIRRVKVQLNLIHERIADPSRGPAPDSPTFWSRVLSFQLDL